MKVKIIREYDLGTYDAEDLRHFLEDEFDYDLYINFYDQSRLVRIEEENTGVILKEYTYSKKQKENNEHYDEAELWLKAKIKELAAKTIGETDNG